MNYVPIGKCVDRVHAAMDQVHQRGARVHEPLIKQGSLNRGPMALIERSEGVSYGSNQGRRHEDEQWGFIPPKEATTLGLHGGAMTERGGSPEWALACATVYGFQRFRAQIKAEVEGFSPRGIPQHVVAAQVVHDGRTEAHPLVAP
jgi:hypothetical protein